MNLYISVAQILPLFLVYFTFQFFLVYTFPANGIFPHGHLQPLGSEQTFEKVEVLWNVPTAYDLYHKYIKTSIPVIFKGAAKQIPAFYKWSDDYLRIYGNWKVVVEYGKKENTSYPTWFMSLNDFLDKYTYNDTYLVHDIVPPNPMTDEIYLPTCIQCGGFQDHIETVVMWFSSGNTKSRLHGEPIDNLECMLDGSKDYLIISKEASENLLKEGQDAYEQLDVDKVDMTQFPELEKISWLKMHVEKGDCYIVPYGTFHQVTSSNSRNLAISFWLTHLYRVLDDCDDSRRRKTILNEVELITTKERSRSMVLDLFCGKENMTHDLFLKFFGPSNNSTNKTSSSQVSLQGIPGRNWIEQKPILLTDKIFRQIDGNNDKIITVSEVYIAPLHLFETLVVSLEEEFERYETVNPENQGKDVALILQRKKRMVLRNEL